LYHFISKEFDKVNDCVADGIIRDPVFADIVIFPLQLFSPLFHDRYDTLSVPFPFSSRFTVWSLLHFCCYLTTPRVALACC